MHFIENILTPLKAMRRLGSVLRVTNSNISNRTNADIRDYTRGQCVFILNKRQIQRK